MRRSLMEAVKIDYGMLRYVLDQSRDCIKILGPDGTVDYINSEGRCALEIDDLNAVLGKPWPDLWPEEARPLVDEALRKAKTGESSEIEAHRPGATCEPRWWQASVSPLMDGDSSLAGILIISRDVTEPVRLRESEQTLLLEMRHRLRNAYTIASAVVMQSAAADDSARSFADSVCGRLADVALSQTRLLEAGKKSWVVSDLVRNLVEAHGEGAAAIRYAGTASATIDGHEAMLVALVIGELTNNSLKYGALRRRRSVSLSWSIDQGQLSLVWREALVGKAAEGVAARDDSSGYSMMARMARAQRAMFSHSIDNGELKVSLTLARRH
ncbi:MAG TPA: PAS domain-containing protein [Sphingomicrobium sp.]|nr:PAS domain-containing protein [Sphingomicrobium sp.]